MIGLLNYGAGNIKAFSNILNHLNIPFKIIEHHRDLNQMSSYILPGVGAFDSVMEKLEISGFIECLKEEVFIRMKPILGICVGMQILANTSEEGNKNGLSWISGDVKKFTMSSLNNNLVIPQIGWNSISFSSDEPLFKGLLPNSLFYFLHSFYFIPSHKKNIMSITNHGIDFASAIKENNIIGLQFHPEKSHKNGLIIIKNFSNL